MLPSELALTRLLLFRYPSLLLEGHFRQEVQVQSRNRHLSLFLVSPWSAICLLASILLVSLPLLFPLSYHWTVRCC